MKGISGEIILGRYRIDRVVGSGGFGTVFAGRQLNLERDVAIKVMRQGPEGTAIARERFRREAVLCSGFSHPNIVTYHDFLIDDDGDMILVMEYLDGETLDRVIGRKGALAPACAARIVVDAALGLDECHRAGIVHRDVKPSNIFLVESGTPRERTKIIDFGILWAQSDYVGDVPGLTRENAFIGTPEYVAPEVLVGAVPDGRTDQYALALVAVRAIAGRMPFASSKGQALLQRLVARPEALDLPALTSVAAVRGVLFKALSPEPGDRFETMDAFAGAMASAANVSLSPIGLRGPVMAAVGGDEPTVVELGRKYPVDGVARGDRAGAGIAAGGDSGTSVGGGDFPTSGGRHRSVVKRKLVAVPLLIVLMLAGLGVGAYSFVRDHGLPAGGAGAPVDTVQPVGVPAVKDVQAVAAPATVVLPGGASPAQDGASPSADNAGALPGTVSATAENHGAPAEHPASSADSPAAPADNQGAPAEQPSASAENPAATAVRAASAGSVPRQSSSSRPPSRQSPERSVSTASDHGPATDPRHAPAAPASPASPAAPVSSATQDEGPDGVLRLNASPWADVSVDGRRAGRTPVEHLELRPGTHTVVFSHPDLGQVTRTVQVRSGDTSIEYVKMD